MSSHSQERGHLTAIRVIRCLNEHPHLPHWTGAPGALNQELCAKRAMTPAGDAWSLPAVASVPPTQEEGDKLFAAQLCIVTCQTFERMHNRQGSVNAWATRALVTRLEPLCFATSSSQ